MRRQAEASPAALGAEDALQTPLADRADQINHIRQKIVATTEGGTITGEERLREHTDELHGAIMSDEGRPTDYKLTYIDLLRRALDDVPKSFADLQNDAMKRISARLQGSG